MTPPLKPNVGAGGRRTDPVEPGAHCALALVQLGKLSAARQPLEGASVAVWQKEPIKTLWGQDDMKSQDFEAEPDVEFPRHHAPHTTDRASNVRNQGNG